MALSNDLISQFVKATAETKREKKEETVYGTVVVSGDSKYVKLDGSDVLTPISTTADTKDGERVTVMIKNHTATITGNISSPAARVDDLVDMDEVSNKIAEFEIIIADKVSTESFDALDGRVSQLQSDNVLINNRLIANEASIDSLEAEDLKVNNTLIANQASIDNLEATKIDAEIADARYATIKNLDATNANVYNLSSTYADFEVLTTDRLGAVDASIDDLEANKLDATSAELMFANIDFTNISKATMAYLFTELGIIEDLIVGDATISGKLVGVTISGDLIEGNTVKADKLVVKGTDGLYYKLNTDGMTTTAEQTEYNSLNGGVILANSITAEKISVDDLVAFGATIGGFNITDSALYSGVKTSVDNTTNGVYLDKEGQFALGDSSNYLKYYQDQNGVWRLEISSDTINMGSGDGSLSDEISALQLAVATKATQDDLDTAIDAIQVGGRNLAIGSAANWTRSGFYRADSAVGGAPEFALIEDDTLPGFTVARWKSSATTTSCGPWFHSNLKLGIDSFEIGAIYTASMYMKSDVDYMTMGQMVEHQNVISLNVAFGSSWTRIFVTFKAIATSFNICFYNQTLVTEEAPYIYMAGLKIERGNKPTDWTPATEDIATSLNLETTEDTVQNLADQFAERLEEVELTISSITNSISTLVTDTDGGSLMEQTSDGWIFSMGETISQLQSTVDTLTAMEDELASHGGDIDTLRNVITGIEQLGAYVRVTADDGEPCIELGNADAFKLRITNTSIKFMDGTTVPAYVSNDSLKISKAEVEDELIFGGFAFAERSNGNMGLIWKGGSE